MPDVTTLLSADSGPNAVEVGGLFINVLLLFVAIAAGVAAVRSFGAMREANDAAREANEQARRDSIEQSRPYVYAEIVPGLWDGESYDLRISNVGLTAAYDLTMQFDSWPTDQSDPTLVDSIRRMFETNRLLPPRSSLRTLWRHVPEAVNKESEDKNKESKDRTVAFGMPGTGTITMTYFNADRALTAPYVEQTRILIYDSGEWPLANSGNNRRGDARKDLSPDAKHIGEILEAQAKHTGYLRW